MGSTKSELPYLTTFKVADVEPNKVDRTSSPETDKLHIATQLQIYSDANCDKFIQGSSFGNRENLIPADNGFVKAATKAYNGHHHLILRPDDIWLSIITQFSYYVNDNAEELRSQFVNFEGKKVLTVQDVGSLYTVAYERLVEKMQDSIHQNLVDGEVRDWILPNFSTTTIDDRITSCVVFMAAMKKFFDYRFCLMCGIPSVTLDGTLSDWKEIRHRIDKLDTYKLKDWTGLLRPILDEFVNAKAGNPNVEFWNQICHYKGGGSGPTYLCGWITAFCHFDQEGNRKGIFKTGRTWAKLDTKYLPPGVVKVSVVVDDNGIEYNTVMLAGSMGMEIGKDGDSLQPRSGWIIALEKN